MSFKSAVQCLKAFEQSSGIQKSSLAAHCFNEFLRLSDKQFSKLPADSVDKWLSYVDELKHESVEKLNFSSLTEIYLHLHLSRKRRKILKGRKIKRPRHP